MPSRGSFLLTTVSVIPKSPSFHGLHGPLEADSPIKVRGSSIFAIEDASEHSMSFDAAEDDQPEQNTSIVDVTILDSSLVLRESAEQTPAADEIVVVIATTTPTTVDPIVDSIAVVSPIMTITFGESPAYLPPYEVPSTHAFADYQVQRPSSSSELSSFSDDHLLSPAASEGNLTIGSTSSDFATRQDSQDDEISLLPPVNPTPAGKKAAVPQMTPLATALGDFAFSPTQSSPSPIDQQASIRLGAIPPSPSSPTAAALHSLTGSSMSQARKRNSVLVPSQRSEEKRTRRYSMTDTAAGRRSPSVKLKLFEPRARTISMEKPQQQQLKAPYIFEDLNEEAFPEEESSGRQHQQHQQHQPQLQSSLTLQSISDFDQENLNTSPKKRGLGEKGAAGIITTPGKKAGGSVLKSPAKGLHPNRGSLLFSPTDAQRRRSFSESGFH